MCGSALGLQCCQSRPAENFGGRDRRVRRAGRGVVCVFVFSAIEEGECCGIGSGGACVKSTGIFRRNGVCERRRGFGFWFLSTLRHLFVANLRLRSGDSVIEQGF